MRQILLLSGLGHCCLLLVDIIEVRMESETYVSCLAWIQKGFAARVPREVELTKQEMEEMREDPMVQEGYVQSHVD